MIYSINMHTTVYQFWRFVYHHEQSGIDHYARSLLYTRSFCTGIKLYVGHFLWPRFDKDGIAKDSSKGRILHSSFFYSFPFLLRLHLFPILSRFSAPGHVKCLNPTSHFVLAGLSFIIRQFLNELSFQASKIPFSFGKLYEIHCVSLWIF